MLVVHVHIRVKPEHIEAFKTATIENASNSVKEPGIARFDFVQNQEDPADFMLVEAYRTPEATVSHKETDHYLKWADTVTPMMAEPRTRVRYSNVFPEAANW